MNNCFLYVNNSYVENDLSVPFRCTVCSFGVNGTFLIPRRFAERKEGSGKKKGMKPTYARQSFH